MFFGCWILVGFSSSGDARNTTLKWPRVYLGVGLTESASPFALIEGCPTHHNCRKRLLAQLWQAYAAKTTAGSPERIFPFKDLNGFCYHENWLHSLLIASSMNGRKSLQNTWPQNPLEPGYSLFIWYWRHKCLKVIRVLLSLIYNFLSWFWNLNFECFSNPILELRIR